MEPRNLTGLNPTLEEIEINLKAGTVAAKKSAHSAIIMARGRIALPRYSVYEIFKVLWLSYTDLKYRIQPGSVGELAFVELDLSAPLSTAICIVEMQNQDGAKMRMYFKGNVGHISSAGISVNDTRILFEK